MKDQLKVAADIMGMDLENMSFVTSETLRPDETTKCFGKVHIMGFTDYRPEDDFATLCGIEDVCGFWPNGSSEGFNSDRGCKNCKKLLKELKK